MRSIITWAIAGVLTLTTAAALAAPPTGDAPADKPHLVRGEVTTINEARGSLTLKTPDGDQELRLPPALLKGVKKGDRVTVQLAVKRNGTPTARATR